MLSFYYFKNSNELFLNASDLIIPIAIAYVIGYYNGRKCVLPKSVTSPENPLSHCIKLLCNFRVSVKVNHSTLVYIVYYNVKLLALIIYKCINYIALNTSNIFIL